MAVIETEKTCDMILRVATGTSAGGKTLYSSRTFGDMNPESGLTAMYNFGVAVAGLQTHTLGEVRRRETAVLAEE